MKTKTGLRLWKYVSQYKEYLFAIVICALASNILAIITPILAGKGIDYMIAKGEVNFPGILRIIISLAGIYAGSSFFQWLLSILTNRISNLTVKDIRQDAFNKISTFPLKYFDTSAHGDTMSRLTNDINAISEGLLQGITQLFSGVVTIVGSLIFMLVLSPVITLVVVLVTPLCFLIASFITRMSNKMFREQSKTLGELNGYIEEIIGNQKVVKAFGFEKRSQKNFEEINERLYTCGRLAQFYSSLTNPATRFVNNIAYILVGIIGGIYAVAGGLTIGKISSFLTYSTQFSRPINEITSVITQLQAAFASAERVFAILDQQPEIPEPADMPVLKECEGYVRFDDVSFSYRSDVPLIQNLNLSVNPGNTIAIVGPTGAGKTTLVNLLMRFYDADSGEISIDNKDVQRVKRDSLRRSFGMVLQESWLFSGTVRENIAYAKPEATEEEIICAAKSAHAHSFIKRLPQGYDTMITEEGGNLSQGQKQLLTIARVMLVDPPMLILDEATSSVDTLTEARIQKAFLNLMKGRTSFVIAHRLSTIREADLILVMNNGQIIEQGTHTELMNKGAFYSTLYNSQFAPSA